MIGMQFVLPALLFLALLLLGLATIIGTVFLLLAAPLLAMIFTLYLFKNISFSRHFAKSAFALLISTGAYLFLIDTLKYAIFYKWQAAPFGRPLLDTFRPQGLIIGAVGFLAPFMVLSRANFEAAVEKFAESLVLNFLGAILMQTLIAWPLTGLLSGIFQLKLGWQQAWLWSWALFAPFLFLIILTDTLGSSTDTNKTGE